MATRTRYVALLRGVNVGGHNKVSMPKLRAAVEELGVEDVETYIASGNVLFTSAKAVKAADVEKVIEATFGIDAVVMVRTAADLKRILSGQPFKDADPKTVHVGFYEKKPAKSVVDKLDAEAFAPEQFGIKGTELYLLLPNGMGRTKLPAYLDRQVKVPVTIRNLKTVMKLRDLAAG